MSRKHQWVEIGPWKWQSTFDSQQIQISLRKISEAGMETAPHWAREGYRRHLWQVSLQDQRRGFKYILKAGETTYRRKARTKLSKIPICPELRAVLVGSFYSLAATSFEPGKNFEVVSADVGFKVKVLGTTFALKNGTQKELNSRIQCACMGQVFPGLAST